MEKNNKLSSHSKLTLSRRQFTTGLLGAVLFPGAIIEAAQTPTTVLPQGLLASAAKDSTGQYALYIVKPDGSLKFRLELPGRAHHIAAHPDRPWLAVIARRPGTFLWVIDYQEERIISRQSAQSGQHFYGHGVFSPDGKKLVTTENHIASGEGRVTVRDTQDNFIVKANHSSHGIGPHELHFMPYQKTLVIANGGILTHPDHGREKLNLDTMEPSLVYIDIDTGRMIERQTLPKKLRQLSIRHLDVNGFGQVWIGMQYQGDAWDSVPLVASHQMGQSIRLLYAPETINAAMKQYCGSVRFDQSGRYAAVSSPRGNMVTIWDAWQHKYLTRVHSEDGCGIAAQTDSGFLISSGVGKLTRVDLTQQKPLKEHTLSRHKNISWDNHLTPLT